MAEGGNGFDPCECVYSPEAAMRRLMNMLRDSQGACMDNECLTQNSGFSAPGGGNTTLLMFMFFGWIGLMLFLFFMRPNSLRGSRQQTTNKRPPRADSNDEEPPSPGIH